MAKIRNQISLDLVTATPATIYNTANLGTVMFKLPNASSFSPMSVGVRVVQFSNRHATNYVSFLPTSAASPTAFVATSGNTISDAEGINIPPGGSYFWNGTTDLNLWVVASAISTPFQAVLYEAKVI